MGEYLNRVHANGGIPALGDTSRGRAQTALDDYALMLTQLGTEFYAEQQALALNGVQRFARNLQNCGTPSIGETAGDENGCFWVRYDDNPRARDDAAAGFPAAESNGFSISQGLQMPARWRLDARASASTSRTHSSSGFDGLWTADSKFIQLGASARRDLGPGSVGATLRSATTRRT